MEKVEAFPLKWPSWIKRNLRPERSRFGSHSVANARDAAAYEIGQLGGRYITISSNIALRRDGLPYSNQAKPRDCGIAIYFELKGKALCFACDAWDDPAHNLWAIAKDTEAQRGRLRWKMGSAEQAFAGYEALPPPKVNVWWEVLGIDKNSTSEGVKKKFNELALIHHPDKGGNVDVWHKILSAYQEGSKS